MATLDDPTGFLESTSLVPIELHADADGRVRYVGPQARELLGHPVERWYQAGFWTTSVLPDDQSTVADARRNSVEARGRHAIDYRMETAEGRVLWVSEMLRYVDGSTPTLRGFLWNVTDRKRQEVALWRNERRLRALVRRAPDAMVLTDHEGRVLNMNDQAEALFDYRLSEMVGSSIDHLLPEPLRPRLAELRAAFDRDPARRSLVDGHSFAIQRSDGNEIPVELSVGLVAGADDERQLLWSARDLTVRRRVEAQQLRSEKSRRADAPRVMACSVDTDGRYRWVDDAYARWHGHEPCALVGRCLDELLDERALERLRPSMQAALRGASGHLVCEIESPDGGPLSVQVGLVPQHDGAGIVTGYAMLMFPA